MNFFLLLGDCSCSDAVHSGSYVKKCEKSYAKNGRTGPICYVNQPSTCTDKQSAGAKGYYSWDACLNKKGNIV